MDCNNFDIVKYICGLTDYDISESVATNIALERGLENASYHELTKKDKDLLLADVIFSLALRPKKTASISQSHGGYSVSKSGIEMHNLSELLRYARSLYIKWGEEAPDLGGTGSLQWL